MLSFKVAKFGEFIKGYIVDWSDMPPDGPVKIEDLWMGAWVKWCKVRINVVLVLLKFVRTMRENELCCPECNPPSDDSVSMSFHSFSGFWGPKMKFKVTNIFNGPIIRDSGIHAWENNIKIDHLSCQDIVPFGIRELRNMFWTRTIRLVVLRSRTWFWTSLRVCSWLVVRSVLSPSSSASQAKSNLSRDHFLDGVRPSVDPEWGL